MPAFLPLYADIFFFLSVKRKVFYWNIGFGIARVFNIPHFTEPRVHEIFFALSFNNWKCLHFLFPLFGKINPAANLVGKAPIKNKVGILFLILSPNPNPNLMLKPCNFGNMAGYL